MSSCCQESHQPRPQRHAPLAASFEETNNSLALALEELVESGTLDSFIHENGLFESLNEACIDPQMLQADEDNDDVDDVFSDFDSEPELSSSFSEPRSSFVRKRRHSIGTPGSGELKRCPFPGCSKLFERSYNLNSHLKIHVMEKPYQCKECESSFTRGHDLKRHMNTHSRVQVISCSHCKRRFSRQDALRRHIRLGACQPAPPQEQQEQE